MLLQRVTRFNLPSEYNRGIIGVVIPFQYTDERPDGFERIENIIRTDKPVTVNFYVVDSGSPKEKSIELEQICLKYKANYIYIDSRNELFSAGKARNIGAIYANTEFIFFQDVDCPPYEGFYDELLEQIEIQELREKQNDFIMVPCVYLTQEGSEYLYSLNPKHRKNKMIMALVENDKKIIQNFAPASSLILVNRYHYLSIGGNSREFRGHGFEDFELINRLASLSNKFIRPIDYYNDIKKWSTDKYLGFRSMYRLFGDYSLLQGLILFHVWHKPSAGSEEYKNQNRINAKLLVEKLKEFDNKAEHPVPLPDIYRGKTLVLSNPTSAFLKSIWQTIPSFGELTFKTEQDFSNEQEFLDYFLTESFDRILMPNPYGNDRRLMIYKALKEKGLTVIVSDRGALPDSIFFDEGGFNADSSSYSSERWDKPLNSIQIARIKEYVLKQKYTDNALERQGRRIGADALAEKYKITSKKVLFIPFQRPSDTVIRYFSGAVNDMDEFIQFIERVVSNLSNEWTVLAKKHPLEQQKPMSNKIIFVDDDTHINDLLDLADAILLINSGVGLLGMMWEKPVLYVGEAFYGHEGLNKKVNTSEEAINVLNNGELFQIDSEKMLRFLHYLVFEFYSFGKMVTEIVTRSDGSMFNVTRNIFFYQISIPSYPIQRFILRDSPQISYTSILFDKYRTFLELKKKGKTATNVLKKESVDPLNQETTIQWILRQAVKLITNPKQFIFHYKRWSKKRHKRRKRGV